MGNVVYWELFKIIRCKLLGKGVGESLNTQDILKGTVDAFKSDGKNKKQQQQTEAVYQFNPELKVITIAVNFTP